MTPTHRIVPEKDFQLMLESIADSYTTFPEDWNAIPVDLSEEGIKQRAEKVWKEIGASDHFSGSIIRGAELFAKNLLNLK